MPLPSGYNWKKDWNYSDYAAPSREEIEYERNEPDPIQEWDWQNPQNTGPEGQALPELAVGWKPNGEADFGTGLGGWWNKVVSNVKSAWDRGYEEGLKISGVTEWAAEKVQGEEKAAVTLEKMKEERKPETKGAAIASAVMESSKEVLNQALWGVLDALSMPAIWTEQAIGAVVLSAQQENPDWERNWQASRLAYSALFDSTIIEEMNRRLDSGMRGDLAAQEIMTEKKWTLWPELIGQVIFDPLNVVTLFGKAGQAAKVTKNVKKTFHVVENAEIAKLIDISVDALKNMDEAEAYRHIDDLVKAQQTLSHAEDIARAGGKLDELSKSFKLSSLTRDGKIAHLANQTGEIMMHVVNNSTSDEALEILNGMVKSVSPDSKIAAEGVSTMLHFADPQALFSEAGNNTTVMLSKMMGKYGDDWLKNLDTLKNDPTALTKDLLTKLDEVGEEMFPSVSSMLKAEDAVKAGDTSEKIKNLATRAAELPPSVRSATKFHENAQKFVGPINKFFIGAYMGWSPGYAFRNFSNNTLQILIDHGPGVLLGNADNMFSKAEKLHGGMLQGAHGFGQEASVIQKTGAEGASGLKAIIGAAAAKGLRGPALGLAEKLELNAAKRILAKTYTRTFEKGTGAMVKALTPDLRAAGFSDDLIRKLPTYIMQNDGDAVKAINSIRADVDSGVMDVFNDISRIDPKYKSFLSDAGKWDEYSDTVLKAESREAAELAAKKIFDDLAQAGDYVYSEGRAANNINDQFLKMAESEGGLPSTRGQLISLRQSESEKAVLAADDIVSEADNLAGTLGLRVGDLHKAVGLKSVAGAWGADAAKEARRLQDMALKLYKSAKNRNADLKLLWKSNPEFFGTEPQILTYDTFADALWSKYDELVSTNWGGARDAAVEKAVAYLDNLKQAGVPVEDNWYQVIKTAQEGAQQYDNVMIGKGGNLIEETRMAYGARTSQISQMAAKYGIETVTEAGVPLDKKTLSLINKYAGVKYESLEDVPIQVAEEAFKKKAGTVEAVEAAAHYDDAGNLVEPTGRILPPPVEGEAPTIARAIYEQKDDVGKMRSWMMDDIARNFGKKQLVNKVEEAALQKAERELAQKLAETRLISSRVAQANRDFTLLNYGEKSYWDTALAYLYPFHFWYKGTYKNWLKRIASNPAILAHYNKYKENLGTVHADMPEWWKYNINTNDLPGVDVENPLYFNLEATLWPLNGLTNTDFNDPSKRVNFWTYALDFANKFGPSTWSPINMVTGLALYQQGEKEAGERWMGRLFPQSATIKAGASLLGIANAETDPLVKLFQGDLDPYERRRVGRALAEMEQLSIRGELPYTREQIQDAAYAQEGEIWEEAIRRAVRGRAPSQLSSFLFGVGFKGRTSEDMQIDKFYTDYNRLWAMRPNITPEEFREGMDSMKSNYPFMDTVLLSRRSGVERDAGLAYLVLSRIPPGQTTEIANAVGVDSDLMNKFFDDKGQIDKWTPADRSRFMAGVMDIAAILEIPSDTTRTEWTKAKNAYSGLTTEAKSRFGETILDMVDGYYVAKTKSYDAADAYLDKYPQVQDYMNWRSARIINSPLLSSYYGGASVIENYQRSQMYAEIESTLGEGIFDVVSQYQDVKTWGTPEEAKQFYRQHRAEIKRYYQIKDDWEIKTNQEVARLLNYIPEGQPAGIREDIDVTSLGGMELYNSLQGNQPTFEDVAPYIPSHLMGLVQDYFVQSEPLPESAERQLDRLANELGLYDRDELLQIIGQGVYAGQ